MTRTRIIVEGTGELLHEGPTAPTTLERVCNAAHRAKEETYRWVNTPWGRGYIDPAHPHRVNVENLRKRPVL